VTAASARTRRRWRGRPFVVSSEIAAVGVALVALVVAIALVFWRLAVESDRLARHTAIESTALFARALREFRSLYSSEVVSRLRAIGVEVVHDYDQREHAVPLPATLAMEVGRRVGLETDGMTVRLYSEYPFPWRREDGGPRDGFEREALAALAADPSRPFERFEDEDGRTSLRYAVADRMGASCVGCHNSYPGSPRTDWQEGDVCGVLAISRPFGGAVAAIRGSRGDAFLVLGAVGGLGVIVILILVRRGVASAIRLREANRELTSANGELARRSADLEASAVEHASLVASMEATTAGLELAIARADESNVALRRYAEEAEDSRRAALNLMQDMEVTARRAGAAARAKASFLDTMSHELRTPLNGIVGMTGLLLETRLDTEQLECAQVVRKSADALLVVLDDILDFSTTGSMYAASVKIDFDPRACLYDIAELLREGARAKGLAFAVACESLPSRVHGDPRSLRQALVRLVGNAIKFTRAGSVRLVAIAERCDAERVSLRYVIEDSGVGIPAERLEKLFEPFSQIDSSAAREHGGTGMGLAFARRLVDRLGGEISIESTVGVGTRVTLRVSFAARNEAAAVRDDALAERSASVPHAAVESSIPQPPGAGPSERGGPTVVDARPVPPPARILVVEDNAVNQKVALRLLERLGFDVDVVGNGVEALEALARATYGAVLMDCQMPQMDGFTAARAIRAGAAGAARDVPIIALTANARAGDRERCIEAGMDDYLAKPVEKGELAAKLAAWLSRRSERAGADRGRGRESGRTASV